MQAVRDNIVDEETMLAFKKDDLIRLSGDSNATNPPGFWAGQLNGRRGLFPQDAVRAVSRNELPDLSRADEKACDPFLDEILKMDNNNSRSNCTDQSINYQDGHFSMMEFAMMYFKQSLEK